MFTTRPRIETPTGSRAARRSRHLGVERLEGRALLTAGVTPVAGTFNDPVAITTGADDNLWVLNSQDRTLSVINPGGLAVKATIPIPGTHDDSSNLTLGPDGNVWFVETGSDLVAKVTPAGVVTEYPLDGPRVSDLYRPHYYPVSIATGPDGALWVAEYVGHSIARVTTDGVVTQYGTPSLAPSSIAEAGDKSVWFLEVPYLGHLGRLNADGTVTTFPLPPGLIPASDLTAAPDGSLDFLAGATPGLPMLVHVSAAGAMTETPIRVETNIASGLSFDAAGDAYVVEGHDTVVRVNPDGGEAVIVPGVSPDDYGGQAITVGPDGALWVTNGATAGAVDRVDPGTVTSAPVDHALAGTAFPYQYIPSTTFPQQPAFSIDKGASSGEVARFEDLNADDTAADYTATVDWGDGTTSMATITATDSGVYRVDAAHNYATAGVYSLTVTVTDVNAAHTPAPAALTLPGWIGFSLKDPGPDDWPATAFGRGTPPTYLHLAEPIGGVPVGIGIVPITVADPIAVITTVPQKGTMSPVMTPKGAVPPVAKVPIIVHAKPLTHAQVVAARRVAHRAAVLAHRATVVAAHRAAVLAAHAHHVTAAVGRPHPTGPLARHASMTARRR